MKVLILRSNPVKPDSRVEKLASELISQGHTVSIFCWDREKNHQVEHEKSANNEGIIDFFRVGVKSTYSGGIKRNLFPLIKFQIKIAKWFKSNRDYDVIHACDFDTGFTAKYLAKKFHIFLVYDIFDYYADSFLVPKFLSYFIRKLEDSVIKKAHKVIICNETRYDQIKHTGIKEYYVIHNTPKEYFFDSTLFNINKCNSESQIKISYVGILSDGRLIKELLEIVSLNQYMELHIAGFGKYENLVRDYSENSSNIFYYGRVQYNVTLKIESSCDIITAIYDPNVKNHKYASPNKFYEALFLGKPLIVCKNTGIDEIVGNFKLGEIIDYSKDSLEKAINNLINKRDMWNEISINSKKLYNSMYSWDIMSKRIYQVYESLKKED